MFVLFLQIGCFPRALLLELLDISCGSSGGGALGIWVAPCYMALWERLLSFKLFWNTLTWPWLLRPTLLSCCRDYGHHGKNGAGFFFVFFCFGSNIVHCCMVWLSLWLAGCLHSLQLGDCASSCTIEMNFLWASSTAPENLEEKVLGPNQAISHSRFPKPWGLLVRGVNLCGLNARHAAGGSAQLQAEHVNACLGKQISQREASILWGSGGEGLKQLVYPFISIFK